LILGEVEVWSRQIRITVQKGHNFWSDRWIAIKFLLEFLESVLLGVDLELLLGEAEVLSRQTRVIDANPSGI
jgi:hypothetical protein